MPEPPGLSLPDHVTVKLAGRKVGRALTALDGARVSTSTAAESSDESPVAALVAFIVRYWPAAVANGSTLWIAAWPALLVVTSISATNVSAWAGEPTRL